MFKLDLDGRDDALATPLTDPLLVDGLAVKWPVSLDARDAHVIATEGVELHIQPAERPTQTDDEFFRRLQAGVVRPPQAAETSVAANDGAERQL
jgi:hypothetical protein